MSIRNKAIVLNLAMALGLAVESRFHPAWAIVTTAAILFPIANGILLLKAWKK